jgi:uncharacterized protein
VSARGCILDDFLAGGPIGACDVVDCHSHMGPALYMHVPDGEPDGVVAVMDALGVDMACISHSIAMVSDPILGNTHMIEAVRRHPERIFGYAVFNPRYPAEMSAELDRCAAAGLRGLKIHPDFHDTPADSPLYEPLYERAAAENRVLLCHYGAGRGPRAGSHLYRDVVRRHPDVTYIMAHSLPALSAVDTAVEYFGDNPKVSFCLANAFPPGVIEYACERLGPERLLYGSDGGWGAMAPRLGLVCATDLDDDAKKAILGANMRRILDSVA